MEEKIEMGMLDLMTGPCFCVKDFRIVKVNREAARLSLTEGMDLAPMLATGSREYAELEDGCLFLNLDVNGVGIGASVVKVDGVDVFLLEQEFDSPELKAMALAAQMLREPLGAAMINQEQLCSLPVVQDDPEARDRLNRLNRSLSQLQRIIGNMSDAHGQTSRQEYRNITLLVREIIDKAQTLVAHTGVTLTYEGLGEQIYSLADAHELERALLNLLSNALKHTPAGGTIRVSLSRRDRMLYLRIRDSGSGIASEVMGNVFRQFLRQPGYTPDKRGIGLGMVLVRTAAVHHGGTVLIDQPEGAGTRVTMTIAIRQNGSTLRSPVMRIDYEGGRDNTLIELSEVLPQDLFENE